MFERVGKILVIACGPSGMVGYELYYHPTPLPLRLMADHVGLWRPRFSKRRRRRHHHRNHGK
jgi:hypothetical protein